MKHTIFNTLKIIGIAAVLSVGVSYIYVSAFNQPTVGPGTSASNVATPVHTGSTQEKKGGIWSKKVLASPISMFKKSIFLPGKNSSLRIGSDDAAGTQNFTKGSAGAISQSLNTAIFGDDNTVPLVIDLHGRTKPQDAIEFKNTMCPIVTRFTNDKAAAFEFKQGTNAANIIARQVQLTGGDPDANDVLLGDASGNARWAKATVVNGAVVFSSGVSPVIEGQTCVAPIEPPVDVCTNITGNQTTVPTGYHVDPVGSTTCVANTNICYLFKSNCGGTPSQPSVKISPTAGCSVIDQGIMCSGAPQQISTIQCGRPLTSADLIDVYNGGTSAGGATVSETSCDIEEDIAPWTLGCFIENTKVTMANGTKKDIEDIKVGDTLKAVSGVNTVQKLLRPKLNDQDVYSINGSDAFFTANHPFLTTNGWKSLDPKKTHVEIPTLPVTQMKVGDVLITESKNITIRSIDITTKPADTQLYNFELDGDHTYYANGYAVHNKEATLDSDPNPACDLNPSTSLSDCREFNHYYCKVASGNSQGRCIPTVACGDDTDCRVGPTIGTPPNQLQLTNGNCLVPTTAIHPSDAGDSFCKW